MISRVFIYGIWILFPWTGCIPLISGRFIELISGVFGYFAITSKQSCPGFFAYSAGFALAPPMFLTFTAGIIGFKAGLHIIAYSEASF
jgi:hypothetical protein